MYSFMIHRSWLGHCSNNDWLNNWLNDLLWRRMVLLLSDQLFIQFLWYLHILANLLSFWLCFCRWLGSWFWSWLRSWFWSWFRIGFRLLSSFLLGWLRRERNFDISNLDLLRLFLAVDGFGGILTRI